MKRKIFLVALVSLLIAVAAVIGYNEGKGSVGGNSPEAEGFSTVIQMNGKELTVGAPTFSVSAGIAHLIVITVVVKNTGHGLISLAELELVPKKPDGSEWTEGTYYYYSSSSVVVKNLSVGEVTTLCWLVDDDDLGSFNTEVIRLE